MSWTSNLVCLAIPILLGPILVVSLRPLFVQFLKQGVELFADEPMAESLTRETAHRLAWMNVLVLVATWTVSFGCMAFIAPTSLAALPAVAGILGALVLTIRSIERHVALHSYRAALVGLLAFTGGNLPIFLIVPAALLVL